MASIRANARDHLRKLWRPFTRMVATNKLKTLIKTQERLTIWRTDERCVKQISYSWVFVALFMAILVYH